MSSPSGPIQRLVRSLLVLVCVCVLGLIAGIVLVSVQNAETSRRLADLEDYVQGKGEQRDRENDQLRELIRKTQCDLLDTFPEGGLLDRARDKYHCGPGIPLDRLTPAERSQLAGHPPSSPPSLAPKRAAPPTAPTPKPPPATTPPPAAPATPTPPSAPPSRPALICGLLPPLC